MGDVKGIELTLPRTDGHLFGQISSGHSYGHCINREIHETDRSILRYLVYRYINSSGF